jgi:hypothetical protein
MRPRGFRGMGYKKPEALPANVLVLTDYPEGTKSSCGSYGAVVGLSQTRQGLKTLHVGVLAFGEDHGVDLLEEFAVQHLDASWQLRRRYHETHGQLRAAAG